MSGLNLLSSSILFVSMPDINLPFSKISFVAIATFWFPLNVRNLLDNLMIYLRISIDELAL